MHIFLTKGLAATDVLRSDVKQGYALVRRAAHLLSNDDKLSAAEIRQSYETLLAEMEHTPMSSEPLATMLSTFRPRHDELLAWSVSLLRCPRSPAHEQRVRAVFWLCPLS
jgi:hypothetical protein